MKQKITGMYTALQERLLREHDVILCDGTIDGIKCQFHSITVHRCAFHKGPENRRIRNWKQENTVKSTFVLLHEIGHLYGRYDYKVEDEYKATEWALRRCLELHLIPDRDMITSKQMAINRMYDKEAERFSWYDLYGLKKPDWLKDREYYSVVRLYDELFPEQIKKKLLRCNAVSPSTIG